MSKQHLNFDLDFLLNNDNYKTLASNDQHKSLDKKVEKEESKFISALKVFGVFAAIIIVIIIANNYQSNNTSNSSNSTSDINDSGRYSWTINGQKYKCTKDQYLEVERLSPSDTEKSLIESKRSEITELENKIKNLRNQAQSIRYLAETDEDTRVRYNSYIDQSNELYSQYKSLLDETQQKTDAYNAKLQEASDYLNNNAQKVYDNN